MRPVLLLLALLAAAILPVAAAAAPGPSPPPAGRVIGGLPLCDQGFDLRHARGRGEVRRHRLGDLPPGDLVRAVVRREGRCIRPEVVREGVGAGGR